MLRGEVGCTCVVAREVSAELREEVWASAGVQGAWLHAPLRHWQALRAATTGVAPEDKRRAVAQRAAEIA